MVTQRKTLQGTGPGTSMDSVILMGSSGLGTITSAALPYRPQ